jgi:hypothetical protein
MALRGCVNWRGGHGLRATLDAVPEIPAAGDESDLGALLALLQGVGERFRTVQLTFRVWRHEHRLQEAFRAHIEAQKRRGGVVCAAAPHDGGPGPAETKETIRICGRVNEFVKSITVDGVTVPTASSMAHSGGRGASR